MRERPNRSPLKSLFIHTNQKRLPSTFKIFLIQRKVSIPIFVFQNTIQKRVLIFFKNQNVLVVDFFGAKKMSQSIIRALNFHNRVIKLS